MSNRQSNEWFHSIPLGDGTVTNGNVPLYYQERKAECIPNDLTGANVLDVGTRDGYFAFEAEKRGAKDVMAVDVVEKRETFSHAHGALNSEVEYRQGDILDMEFNTKFDVVICYGVLYHVPDPGQLIDRLVDLTEDTLCLESSIIPSVFDREKIFYSNTDQGQPFWADKVLSLYRGWDDAYPTSRWMKNVLARKGMVTEQTNAFIPYRHKKLFPPLDYIPKPDRFYPADSRFALRAKHQCR